MSILKKSAAVSAIAAMLVTSSVPGFAATSTRSQSHANAHAPVLEQASDYRGWGRHHRRGRVDAGDIIAGIGILAGIAILADAASKSDRRERAPEPYPEPRSYPPSDAGPSGNDLGDAVSVCSDAAERAAGDGARVDEINSATRDGNGWRVAGNLSGARSFDCGTSGGSVDYIRLDDASDY